jgi:DUF971 family protein
VILKASSPPPREIKLRRRSRTIEVVFHDDVRFSYSFELLRTHSPSAEVQGHGPGQDVLQIAKENVQVLRIEPVGHYAIRLHFDDGHNTGLYSWDFLRELGETQEQKWARYLERLDGIGYVRKPVTPPTS